MLFLLLLAVSTLMAAAYAIMAMWTVQMESKKCACSAGWKRSFIRFASLAAIVLIYLRLFVTLSNPFLLPGLASLVTLALYLVTVSYVEDMHQMKCECSKDWKRKFSLVFSMIILGMITLVMAGHLFTGPQNPPQSLPAIKTAAGPYPPATPARKKSGRRGRGKK
jgi:hypothetical protein